MEFKKKYLLTKWNEWDQIIFDAAESFLSEFGYSPNILEANEYTFSQFDFIADINPETGKNGYWKDDITGEKKFLFGTGEELEVEVFKSGKYEINFCLDLKLKDVFTMINRNAGNHIDFAVIHYRITHQHPF